MVDNIEGQVSLLFKFKQDKKCIKIVVYGILIAIALLVFWNFLKSEVLIGICQERNHEDCTN
jgi:hypothetical protein